MRKINFPASREISRDFTSREPDLVRPAYDNLRLCKGVARTAGQNSRVPIREFKSASREAGSVDQGIVFPSASARRRAPPDLLEQPALLVPVHRQGRPGQSAK